LSSSCLTREPRRYFLVVITKERYDKNFENKSNLTRQELLKSITDYSTIGINIVMFIEDEVLLSNDTFFENFLYKSVSEDTYIFSFNDNEKEYLNEIAEEPQDWQMSINHLMDYN
jgi:hypothetical protein